MNKIPRSLYYQSLAEKLIPGKSQLLSKKPEMFAPGVWPGYYSKAFGSKIEDLDGNQYLDFSIGGIGANILGYADPDVNSAVISAIANGSSSSLNCYEEVDLANLILSIHPWADMVRYTRGGGEAMALAVRVARTHASADIVLFCGYHGWHDWYLSANLESSQNLNEYLLPNLLPKGIPKFLSGTSIPFIYNNLSNLRNLLELHKGNVAAIVMEPKYAIEPDEYYLNNVRELANRYKVLLVFDEITSGFRITPSGIHEQYKVKPDIAVFSKAISNGFPMAIVIGKQSVMSDSSHSFISSTSWSERVGPVAAIATINKLVKSSDYSHLISIGQNVKNGLKAIAKDYDLDLKILGFSTLFSFKFNHPKDAAMRTFFTQEMLQYGFLASGRFYAMFSHTQSEVEQYLSCVKKVFLEIKTLVSENKLETKLKGDVLDTNMQRGAQNS